VAVYLVHLEPPYKHARHYLGFTGDRLDLRMEEHRKGRGSPLLRAAHLAGSRILVVHVWPKGDRTFERSLKWKKNTPRLCPVCLGA
jgi:hypothetical protein